VRVCALFLVPLLAGAQPPTPESIETRLSTERADRVVAELWREKTTWHVVEARVATGSLRWLKIAARLYAGCDAGICAMLKIDLGDALVKNPTDVLAVAGDSFSARDACSTYGSVQDSVDLDLKKALAAIALREEAVRSVRRPDLEAKKQECLNELHTLRELAPGAFR